MSLANEVDTKRMATDRVGNLLMRNSTRHLLREPTSNSRHFLNRPYQLAVSGDFGAINDVGGTVSYRTGTFIFSGVGNHFCAGLFGICSFA